MTDRYVLVNGANCPCPDLQAWAQWMENYANRLLKRDLTSFRAEFDPPVRCESSSGRVSTVYDCAIPMKSFQAVREVLNKARTFEHDKIVEWKSMYEGS